MLTVLLIEDENYTRMFLKKLILEVPLISNVVDTGSGKEAVELAQEYKPDIIMMDIELQPEENLNGIETAKIINNLLDEAQFVFVTGYSKYAIESFVVHPYDYILKPVKKDKLREVLSKLSAKIIETKKYNDKPADNRLVVKIKNETFFILPNEILFIEKQEKKTLIHTKSNVYSVNQTLTEFESVLKGSFIRVHQSFLVNQNKIKKIKEVGNRSYEIEFYSYPQKAMMSRYKYEEYKEKFAQSI